MSSPSESLQPSPSSLTALLKVGCAIAAQRQLEPLLELIKTETEKALDAERCTVFLHDKERNELWSRVASGLQALPVASGSSPAVKEIRFPAFLGLAGYVLKTGESLLIADAYADPRFNPAIDLQTGYRTRNLLCVPIQNAVGKPIGVFQVLNKHNQATFTKEDEQLLLALGASAGLAIENAVLLEAQKAMLNSFVVTLSSTIDARDPITAGHSERVADFAELLAAPLKLSTEDQEVLHYASLLHDIGKIGIREEVLMKDGRLTIEEYKHIQNHARYTHDILKNIRFENHLNRVPTVAASHHEKMDGTGYYNGLKGEAIPFLSRVLALSDVLDAITSRRQYRSRMPFERVLALLRKDEGSHFDPTVCAALFTVPLYKVAEVLVKERLYKKISSVAHYIAHLDKQVSLAEYEAVLTKTGRTPAEQNLVDLFGAIYYVLPETKHDND